MIRTRTVKPYKASDIAIIGDILDNVLCELQKEKDYEVFTVFEQKVSSWYFDNDFPCCDFPVFTIVYDDRKEVKKCEG